MNKAIIAFIGVILLVGVLAIAAPDIAVVFLVIAVLSGPIVYFFRKYGGEDADFLTKLFFAALLARLAFGLLVYFYDLRSVFGGDALTYNNNGKAMMLYWQGLLPIGDPGVEMALNTKMPGWGMNYLVGAIYYTFGVNFLAAQSLCAVFGATTPILTYFLANKIFSNRRVSKYSAFAIAFFPSFIIWSGQMMKDGLIVFLLVLSILMVMQIQEKFNYAAVVLLILAMMGILSLRFYIFYMVAIAVVGSFVIGTSSTTNSIIRRSLVLIVMGVGLTYFGVLRNATENADRYGNLARVQNSRQDLAKSAQSGFNEDVDVSTTSGAISAIPVGLLYLMLAPFPWQMANARQAITLPEVLAWWAMIPLMFSGIWFALKHRLRNAFPILFFSLMLTIAYSIFQGNVGTAYRQRTQIQVFLFIFIAVGWALIKEKRDDRKAMALEKRRRFQSGLPAGG